MRKVNYLLVILIAFASCSLFKKTTKTTTENSHKSNSDSSVSVNEMKYLTKNGSVISRNNDSISADYTIQFWPKGDVNFSSSGSFSGLFDSILLKGKVLRRNNSSEFTHINVNNKSNLIKKSQSVKNTISNDKKGVKTASVDSKWILIGIPLLFFLVFICFKMLKK